MTEKRFRLRFSDGDNGEVVNQKGVQLSPRQIVDLLNSLYEENEQLRKENLSMKDEQNEMIAHLRKENEKIIENKCTDCELVSLQTRKIDTLTNENEQLKLLLKEAEDEIENLKKSNKGLMESIVEKDEQINKLKKEVDEYKEAIINKVQYYEDIEDFAIKKGLIKKDWAKFDGYD